MKIHEYQAKSIFTKWGIPVSKGIMIESRDQVSQAVREIGVSEFVVKAQVQTGGRGKAGGVKLVKSEAECQKAVNDMLGHTLVTVQSGQRGKEVRKILIAEAVTIAKEYYVAVTLDRRLAKGVVIYSQAGGVDIEETAKTRPEKISKKYFDIVFGLSAFEAREVAFGLCRPEQAAGGGSTGSALAGGPGREPEFVKAVSSVVQKMVDLFIQCDASLVEINPLVVTGEGKVMAIDAKIDFDDNALFRHQDLAAMRDSLEEDPREVEAKKFNLSYVGLEGNVGCMVNGAGLAMATMDVIKFAGGMPANFLDVGGGAKVEQVKAAFKIILQDPRVKAMLVNIFGGIMKCDVVAEGIIRAAQDIKINVPLVVRLEGTNVEKGKELLKNSGIRIVSADGLSQAAALAVELAGKS